MNPDFEHCIFLTGATASGKSSVGLLVAETLDAEIVSLDSMALYRRMNIGTAKPTPAEQQRVKHHMLDIVEPSDEFSLSQYVERAKRVAGEIQSRGKKSLFVGGTPLYLKALLRGFFEGPEADWQLRKQLELEAQEHGSLWLHDKLKQIDPLSAERLHPNDHRRVIRALEVFEKTNQPISQLQQQFENGRAADECHVFVLDRPRNILHQRINRRVEQMFDQGLVDEVRQLLAAEKPLSRTARQAVGYREVIEMFEQGHSQAETIELIQQHTRQFARHQLTWFRGLSECRFCEVAEEDNPQQLSQQITALIT